VIAAHGRGSPELAANPGLISDELDGAFDRAFAPPPPLPRRADKRPNPFDDDATAVEHDRFRIP
jgi:hypothetical protein